MIESLRLLAFCLVPAPALAAVVTYPAPKAIAPSEQYAVEVIQDGTAQHSFVYMVRKQWRSNRSQDASWTTFSFSGEVTVHVTKLKGRAKTCRVLPSSYGIEPTLKGNTASFTLDRPRQVSVEFDDPVPHPMFVFADPLESEVAEPDDPKVLYFGPGVHEVGKGFRIPPDKGVYLAGGAYVKGTLVCTNPQGLRIWGRGILSGEQLGHRAAHLLHVKGWGTRNTLIEGITLVSSPHFNIVLAGEGNTVRNVKMIGWWFSTDGVGVGRKGLVEDCFFKVNDDAIKLYFSGTRVRRCVIWQMENGAALQVSWNMPGQRHGFHVGDCDVIRAEHRWRNDNCAIFCSIHGGSGHMSDYLFEDIRIENAPWRLVNLVMKKTQFSARAKTFGHISNLTFRNITVDGPLRLPNTIRGHNAQHRIANVTFENLRIDGRLITSAEDGNFDIDPESTANIRFIVTPRSGKKGPP